MSNLDEISLMLGEIKADMKHIQKWLDAHEINDKRRFDALANRIDVANGYRGRIETLELHVETSAPLIDWLRKTRWVIAGFIAAMAIMGGAVGGMAATALKWFV